MNSYTNVAPAFLTDINVPPKYCDPVIDDHPGDHFVPGLSLVMSTRAASPREKGSSSAHRRENIRPRRTRGVLEVVMVWRRMLCGLKASSGWWFHVSRRQ